MNNITTVHELILEYSADNSCKPDDCSIFIFNDDEVMINNKKVMSFLKLYCELNNYSELIEKVPEFSQLCIIGEYEQGKKPTENRNQVIQLVHEIQSKLKEDYDIEDDSKELICFFFDSKINFRLQFPFYETTLDNQEELINQLTTEINILCSQYRPLIHIQNTRLKGVFKSDGKLTEDDNFSNYFGVPFSGENEKCDAEEVIKKYLPIIFSSHYDESINTDEYFEEEEKKDDEEEDESESIDQDLNKYDIALHLLDIIIKRTFDDDNELKDIIRALRFTCHGSRKGFESIKTKLIEHQLIDQKEKLLKKIYYGDTDKIKNTFRTLVFYAKRDNDTRYKMWHSNWINATIEAAIYCHDYDIAKLLYKINWTDFIYTGDDFYQFEQGKWLNIKKKAIELRKKINDIIPIIEKFKARITGKLSGVDAKNESVRNHLNDILKKCMTLTSKIKSRAGRDSIISLSSEMFYERGFTDYLDVNPFLLGVKNGVIELTTVKAIFRPCRPDDYISISTPVDYNNLLSKNSRSVRDCLEWLGKMFIDPEAVHYMLKFIASILRGQNNNRIFMSLVGERGGNSKSKFKQALEETLGKLYVWTLPKTFMVASNKQHSNNTTELNGAQKARLVFGQEPARNQKFDSSKIKELTGDDTIFFRKLFEEGTTQNVMFKIIYIANKALQLEEYDESIKNRVISIEMKSVWRKDAPKTIKEQYETRTFKEDPNFGMKIPRMAKGMLWLMVEYYEIYCKEGLTLPKCLQEYNDNFWRDNDMLVNFIETCLIRTESNDDKIKVLTLYEIFKVWYSDTTGSHVPSMEFFKSEMICKLGSTNRNNWLKYKLSEEAMIYAESFDINV